MWIDEIISLRLQSHWFSGEKFSSVYDLVKHLWAIQSQDIGQAMRVVWSRISGSTKKMIVDALRNGEIIRTWPMRGTLHYLAPENVHRMLDLCASKTLPWFKKRREFLWITDKDSELALKIIEQNLRWWKNLTRSELGKVLQEGGIDMQTQRVYHLACYAATRKLICFWPPTEKEETFVLLDERVKKPEEINRDQQLAKLADMYISGHGPITVDDLARWSWLWKTDCKKAISFVENNCEKISYQDKIYYYKKPSSKIQSSWNSVLLLWWFDEYFLWYKDRSIVADTTHYVKLFTKNGIFFPLIVVNWTVKWVRKRTRKNNRVIIKISSLPWVKLPIDAIHEQAKKYATFRWCENTEIINE